MRAADLRPKVVQNMDFFTEYDEGNRYQVQEMVGKGSYGVVCSAIDTQTGQKVAIKKITNIFEHVSDATRILREIKLLRLLRHPDIVEIKHIMLPPSCREFKDIYVVFELMESDLHQVIKANDDLTPQHYQFFLYQLLRAMKYIHTANVFHRDLKPKNVLANADCNLKICDFGLARVAFNDAPTSVFWTDYVATRWYRAPELCGSFFTKGRIVSNPKRVHLNSSKKNMKKDTGWNLRVHKYRLETPECKNQLKSRIPSILSRCLGKLRWGTNHLTGYKKLDCSQQSITYQLNQQCFVGKSQTILRFIEEHYQSKRHNPTAANRAFPENMLKSISSEHSVQLQPTEIGHFTLSIQSQQTQLLVTANSSSYRSQSELVTDCLFKCFTKCSRPRLQQGKLS
eukprot:Gb_05456 [translate_table: standard]